MTRPTYFERYIKSPNPLDEHRARGRRWQAFREVTGANEILDNDSQKHRDIVNRTPRAFLDHTTFLEIDGISCVLVEPYRLKTDQFIGDGVVALQIPVELAPYCGGWSSELGDTPLTNSFLICTAINRVKLEKVLQKLVEAAKQMPPWNDV